MRKIFFVFAALAYLTPATAQQQNLTAVEVANSAALQASSFGAYVHLQGIALPGDGSDAYYFQNGLVCTPDGFSIIKDKVGHCYYRGASAISVPTTNVATIAALRGILTATAPAFPYVIVRDYYGTGNGCPIHYTWNAASTLADDGGYSIKLNDTGAGAGRYLLNEPPTSPWHSCWYGVKIDSPPAGTGTDNAVQMQALLNGAYLYGPNNVHLDSAQGFCIKIASGITPKQGQIIAGDGEGDNNQTIVTGSCLNYTGIPGAGGEYVLTTQSTLTGFGTTPFESPKFRDFTINYFSTDTNPGGCIRLNSIAGGFTDAPTSQQPMVHPEIRNVFCNLRVLNNSTKIGYQISKARDGVLDGVTAFGGMNGIDLEGTENMRIQGCAVAGTYGSEIFLRRQNTFGNNTLVSNCQMLAVGDFGQVIDSLLYDDAQSSVIQNCFFENFSTTLLTSQIHLVNGFTAGIFNNSMQGFGTNWLLVDGHYDTITAYGNGAAGGIIPAAKFLAGNYFYSNTGPRSILSHQGNGISGDEGWPFNSINGLDMILPPGTAATWTANTSGLGLGGYGISEIPVNATFTLPVTGSGNYLEGIVNRLPMPTGTFNLSIQAAQTSGAGQLTCQIEDNGALVGAPIAQAITASMKSYTLAFAQVTTVNAGWRCWNTGTGTAGNPALLARVSLTE